MKFYGSVGSQEVAQIKKILEILPIYFFPYSILKLSLPRGAPS